MGCSSEKSDSSEDEASKPAPVRVMPVRKARFEEKVEAIGTITALPGRLSQASAALEGVTVEILAAEGDFVKAGQPLVRLDDRAARDDVAEKKAARAELEAAVVLLRTPPREAERRALELEVDRGRVSEEIARSVLARLEPLHEKKEVSDQQFYEAKQHLEDASLATRSAQARLDILLLGPKPEAIAEGEAKVARAERAVKAAETRLLFLTLTAPRDGVVSSILCHPGQVLTAGFVAMEIVDASEVFASAWVPGREAARIKPGAEARILIHSMLKAETKEASDAPMAGSVAFVGLSASQDTGAFPVRILLSNHEGRLRLGAAVSVEVIIRAFPEALAVPEGAVVQSEEETTVAIVRDGKAALRHPRLGLRQGGLVQVLEGLDEGDLSITAGAYDLVDGKPVHVGESPGERDEKGKEKGVEKGAEEAKP